MCKGTSEYILTGNTEYRHKGTSEYILTGNAEYRHKGIKASVSKNAFKSVKQ